MESARHRRPLQAQFVPAGRQPRILKRMVKPVEMAVDASVVRVEVRNRRMNVRDEEIAALERAALAAAWTRPVAMRRRRLGSLARLARSGARSGGTVRDEKEIGVSRVKDTKDTKDTKAWDVRLKPDTTGRQASGSQEHCRGTVFRSALRHGLKAVPYRCVFDAMHRDLAA
jgi:hypothetical protein